MADCVYATSGWGIHDERWTAALRTLGHDPVVVSLGRDAPDPIALRAAVAEAAGSTLPVLAGPLGTVTRHLAGLSTRVVGLSWGFDLHDLAAADDLTWLTGLSGLIVDSEPTRAIALAAGVPASAITFLPWGIELEPFVSGTSTVTAASLGLPAGSRLVLSLRAHEELYRVADIIEAFAVVAEAVPSAALVVGHSGSQIPALRSLASQLGIDDRVVFIGTIDEVSLAPLLRGSSVYVTASSVDGTSVTLLQAMAAGTPVVASDTPGNLGWITPGVTGRTFATGDVHELASAIIDTLTSDSTEQVARARALVIDQADWTRNITRLESALFS